MTQLVIIGKRLPGPPQPQHGRLGCVLRVRRIPEAVERDPVHHIQMLLRRGGELFLCHGPSP